MWQVLEIFGVGTRDLPGIKSLNEQSLTCVRVACIVSSCFIVNSGIG